jgi:hypothetical protein
MELTIQSDARVNSLFWIKSLAPSEEGFTRRVLDDLEPFLASLGVPFVPFNPQTTSDLLAVLDEIAAMAEAGARPMIQFDTHGNKEAGLYLIPSQEFVGWDLLADKLRRINIATGNNLCVISAACFGFYIVKQNALNKQVMFYIMIGPPDEISFGYVEDILFRFYKDVFTLENIVDAYNTHLAPNMQLFHSEKLLMVAMARYFRFNCMGEGRRKRIEYLVSEIVKLGARTDPATLKYIRTEAKKAIKPSEATFRKYAIPYLIGKEPSVTFDQIIKFIRTDVRA